MTQQEYYCNLYCSPKQETIITNVETVKQNDTDELTVVSFEATLPVSYTDLMYESCKNVKQKWFENQNVSI